MKNMKKVLSFCFFVIAIITTATAQQQSNLTALATTNGIGLIPAFNLNAPAAMTFAKLYVGKNKRIEFAPDFAMNMENGKPWFGDMWLRYNQPLDTSNKWTATLGFDYSPYFQSFEKQGEKITQCVVYMAYQAKLKFIQSTKNSFVFDYWYNCTANRDAIYGIKGSYLSFTYSREEVRKKISWFGNVNTFFISFSDKSKGFGVSYDGMLMHNKSGLFIGGQLVHSLSPRSATNMKTNWAFSLGAYRTLM